MSAPELVAGQIIGRYAVRAILRRDDASATYHAITAPNREVALKLYDPALNSFRDVLETLARYQTISNALPPHLIAPIIDSGEDPETGARFTVTDFEPNPSLAQLVDLCPLSTAEATILIRNLARGVDLLHSHGVVHSSLHPANLFVGPAPGYEVRIADFGMGLVRTALGIPHVLASRAPWMAPEQMKGPTGLGADVFAAALVIFFAITGRSYWRSCQTGTPDVDEWQREVFGRRVPASLRGRESFVSLSPAIDSAFARALSPSPAERFATVGKLAASLAGALDADAAHVPSVGATKKAAAFGPPALPTTAVDVPPPLPQIEAALASFEESGEGGFGLGVMPPRQETLEGMQPYTGTEGPFVPEVQASEARDSLGTDGSFGALETDGARPLARRRIGYYAAAALAALMATGGAVLALSTRKPPVARSIEPPQAAIPVAAAAPVAVALPLPSNSVEMPAASSPLEPPAVPAVAGEPEVPAAVPEAEPLPIASARGAAPVAAPRGRKPPAAATPRPPAKKPCGKFLKRCD